jgi:hypothetical protein
MREKIERLRQVMPEDEIFILDPHGRPFLSPKAARRLEAMDLADMQARWDAARPEAERAAAWMLEQLGKKAA